MVARFLICMLEGEDGPVIATQEIQVLTLVEVPERWFEFAADFPVPCCGSSFALDDDADTLLDEAMECLPQHVQDLFKRSWPGRFC